MIVRQNRYFQYNVLGTTREICGIRFNLIIFKLVITTYFTCA